MKIHAWSNIGTDMTLCGLGFEEFDSEGCIDEGAVGDRLAEKNEFITCEDCLSIIKWVKRFNNNRQPSK